MLPQIVGPGTFTPSPLAPSAAERQVQGAQPAVGETAAASARPEIANRVDPPKVIPAPLPLPEERRRAEPEPPPDPEAPAGPPPAFDATPLERAREAAFAPVDLIGRPPPLTAMGEPPAGAAPAPGAPPAGDVSAPGEASGTEEAAPAPRADAPRLPDADAARRERLETGVAELRRMAEPGSDRALDLVR